MQARMVAEQARASTGPAMTKAGTSSRKAARQAAAQARMVAEQARAGAAPAVAAVSAGSHRAGELATGLQTAASKRLSS
jgi:hypothetical protein